MKKKMNKGTVAAICAVTAVILFASVLFSKWDAIFQRGDPLPYLAAAARLTDENTFEPVKNREGIYITARGRSQDLFQMIGEIYGVTLEDQLGSSYVFSNGETRYTVSSEIYWGKFTVWTLPSEPYQTDP